MEEVASLHRFYRNHSNIKRQNSFIIHLSIDIRHSNGSIIRHSTIDIRHSKGSTFESAYRRFLDPSCFPLESDGYGVAFDNHRNLAGSPGVFQHGVKMFGLFDHVIIIYLAAFFGKCFTSCPGKRSSILSEKQNFVRHLFLLGWPIWI